MRDGDLGTKVETGLYITLQKKLHFPELISRDRGSLVPLNIVKIVFLLQAMHDGFNILITAIWEPFTPQIKDKHFIQTHTLHLTTSTTYQT